MTTPDTKSTAVKRGPFLKGTVAIVLSFAVAALFAEVIMRGFFADRVTLFPRYHTRADYGDFVLRKTRPSMSFLHTSVDGRWKFTINAQGFRDVRDYPYAKPAGRLRVLALGDSQTQGYEAQQDETYAAGLERWLRGRGVDAEVFNMGISGFSTAEIAAFLETEGMRYRPDVVIYGLFANDFLDNVRVGLYRLRNGKLEIAKREAASLTRAADLHNSMAPLRWLSEHSYFYSFTLNTVVNALRRQSKRNADEQAELEYAIPVGKMTSLQQDTLEALVARMHELCKANGARFIILDIPVASNNRQVLSSVPDSFVPALRTHADAWLSSHDLLGDYNGVIAPHVPHGHRHISAFTHAVYAVGLGHAITEKSPLVEK